VANFRLLTRHYGHRASLLAGFLLIFLLLSASFPSSGAASADNLAQDIPPLYEMVAENDLFELYVDSSTLAFKVLDKRSSYLWHSGLDEVMEDDRLNTSWEAFARSGISIEYLDEKAVNRRVSITNTEHTLEVTPVDQGISAQVTFQEYGITVGLILQLEADGVRVEVPSSMIQEGNSGFYLGRLYAYPFLGAVRGSSVPGYMLLPDGTGSLVRFADSTKADNMYIGRYYGPDLGMIADLPYDPYINNPYPISFPVFGMAHGDDGEDQNAFISVIEKGAAYGELQVHPAGIITNFNFVHNAFVYHQAYFQATNRSGAGVTIVQGEANVFDAVMHFRFLTGEDANYVGMARSYQRYLVDKGLLRKEEAANPNIGMRLEFLGGDKERILLWNRFVPMTTIRQMSDILAGLQIPNPEVIYYGWQPYGASSMAPTSLALDGSLGALDELRALAENIASAGGHFSLYFDPQAALWEEPGYSPRNDLAMAITKVNLEGFHRYPTYYFNLDALRSRYSAFSQDVASQLPVGLALDAIGSTVYSDFRDGGRLNRDAALQAYQTLLAESPERLSFYRPNDYFFGLAQAYYDMPLGDNGYIYTTETVPFLPTVLAGYLPYYGGPLNFSSNRQDDLLRHVEFGIYPSYFLTQEATANMLNTPSAWIYTSSYDQWGEEIRQTYQWMNDLLAPVRGQEIIAHERLANNVFATTYANGHQIIVNYTDRPFEQDGIIVEGQDALLVESQQ
jgi:hypothetical protein